MARFSLRELPEVFLSSAALSAAVSRAAKRGAVRRLAARLCATNLTDAPEAGVRRDRARTLAPDLGGEQAFAALDTLVGALLGTRAASLIEPAAQARAAGMPYDPERIHRFQVLFAALTAWAVRTRPDPVRSGAAFA